MQSSSIEWVWGVSITLVSLKPNLLPSTVATEFAGKVKFVKINTDENIKTAQDYSISGLPSLLVFKNGKALERLVGLMPKSTIITNIEKHL